METPASSMFPGSAQPALDPIGPRRRVDFQAPMLVGTIGGRPVVLARPDQHRARIDEPFDLTVPLTTSRFQRAIDIERGRDAAPYVPSLLGTDTATSRVLMPLLAGVASAGLAALVFRKHRLVAGTIAGVVIGGAVYATSAVWNALPDT